MLQRYLKFILSDRCINFKLQVKSYLFCALSSQKPNNFTEHQVMSIYY